MDRFLKLTRYHGYHMILLELLYLGECSNMAFMVFGGHLPTFTCGNITDLKTVCRIVAENRTACSDFGYQFFSIAIEWNLVCDRVGYIYLITSVQMAGLMVGSILLGQLSDKYGRRRVLIPTATSQIIAGSLTAVSTSWQMFAVFKFLNGFFLGGQLSISTVLAFELIPQRHRLWASMLLTYSPLYIAFAALAYAFSDDWRKLALFSNLASAPGVFMLIFAQESPLWLMENHKFEKAKLVLMRISKPHSCTVASEFESFIENEKKEKLRDKSISDSIYQLCCDRTLLTYTAALSFVWFSIGMINYSLLFNVGQLSGSIFVNMGLFGAIRYTGNLLACLVDFIVTKRFKVVLGTKVVHNVTLGGVMICLVTVLLLMWFEDPERAALPIRGLNLASVSMLAVTFMVLYVVTAQIYPTKIRTVANSACQAFARLGATVAPQTVFMSYFWSPATYLLLVLSAMLQMVLLWKFVPETRKTDKKVSFVMEAIECEVVEQK